jgi:cytochrome c oxidase subunit 3
MSSHYHPFHLVDPSPWPYVGSMAALGLTSGSVMYFHSYEYGGLIASLSFLLIIFVMVVWWRDVIREATYQGHHTLIVQRGLRYGMLLFILSEVMFFFSFFWAFFHSSLSPDIHIGSVWPPIGINVFDPTQVPLLNTVILISSGATVTWSHHAMVSGDRKHTILGLSLTIILGVIFTCLQALEYYEATFTIADSVYGSTFFVATGFHGLHVLIGTSFLMVCFWRILNHHFTKHHHNGFEAAIWYWHFVDYVWIFLYACIYCWGSWGAI